MQATLVSRRAPLRRGGAREQAAARIPGPARGGGRLHAARSPAGAGMLRPGSRPRARSPGDGRGPGPGPGGGRGPGAVGEAGLLRARGTSHEPGGEKGGGRGPEEGREWRRVRGRGGAGGQLPGPQPCAPPNPSRPLPGAPCSPPAPGLGPSLALVGLDFYSHTWSTGLLHYLSLSLVTTSVC